MRISDWSSDVCSSDLHQRMPVHQEDAGVNQHVAEVERVPADAKDASGHQAIGIDALVEAAALDIGEADDGGTDDEAGERDGNGQPVRPMLKPHLAEIGARRLEREEETKQDDRKGGVTITEEEIADPDPGTRSEEHTSEL